MRKVCVKDGETFYQCPGSQQQYKVLYQHSRYERLSRVCPEDTYHYTACYLPSFTPLLFNNTVVAVCGHYVCHFYGGRVYSGEEDTSNTWCNNRVQCYNGGVDEMYCAGDEKVFPCYFSDIFDSTTTSVQVCDGKCDCDYSCDDEWECSGYNYSRVTYIYVRSRAKYLKFRTTTSKINTLRKPLTQQKYYFIHEM